MNLLLVTGASAGIGTSTAEVFLDAGYAVVNLSRRPCPVAGVTHLRCDLSRPDFLADIAEALAPSLVSADRIALVHNASRLVNDTA
ncbi:MAG: SDR family NAD(P)-dependent oxidoreductase, partial [Gammaproteobacteria bacterium]|nr:SDR family NAD(P)-dependent oxidoreductase [Gammaproteobacteria bacterium]